MRINQRTLINTSENPKLLPTNSTNPTNFPRRVKKTQTTKATAQPCNILSTEYHVRKLKTNQKSNTNRIIAKANFNTFFFVKEA
jgi:hypothetical protein